MIVDSVSKFKFVFASEPFNLNLSKSFLELGGELFLNLYHFFHFWLVCELSRVTKSSRDYPPHGGSIFVRIRYLHSSPSGVQKAPSSMTSTRMSDKHCSIRVRTTNMKPPHHPSYFTRTSCSEFLKDNLSNFQLREHGLGTSLNSRSHPNYSLPDLQKKKP
jgi:hypothetical protein